MKIYDANAKWLGWQMQKYADPVKPKPLGKKSRLIQMANSKVNVVWVLRDLWEIQVPEGVTAWRIHCPWGQEHSDGGVAKTFRVYPDTNTSVCFASHGQFLPVRLWAYQNSLSYFDAAKAMLKFYQLGPIKEDYRAKMARLRTPKPPSVIDMAYVLNYLLPTHPKYLKYQHYKAVRDLVVQWSEAEFSTDVEELKIQFNKWKVRLWRLLDSLP